MCRADNDCGSGSCTGGICALDHSGVPCTTGISCMSGVCTGGLCAKSGLGGACRDETECNSQTCINGFCSLKPAGSSCTDGSLCVSGTCTGGVCAESPEGTACTADADCTTGFCSFLNHVCALKVYGGDPCSNGDQCVGSGICDGGVCAVEAANADCQSALNCMSGWCVFPNGPIGFCDQSHGGHPCYTGSDCYSFECTNGYCAHVSVGFLLHILLRLLEL